MTADSAPRVLTGLRGILFDFGGTLDGDGLHWLERFVALYTDLGLKIPRERVRAGFDFAERNASLDPAMGEATVERMVAQHVGWQFEHLGISDAKLERECVRRFVKAIRRAAERNVPMLANLRQAGFRLGVISNGCGNTIALCDELGYTPHLEIVLDSARVRLSKPDPEFFRYAAAQLRLLPSEILMVGDSLERDIEPAKLLRMQTAWLATAESADAAADIVIHSLGDLPMHLPRGTRRTKAGIFAAGEGARLRGAGALKPLVRIGDRALIMHVLEGFAEARVSEVTILINEESTLVQEAVEQRDWPFELRWIVKTTPSSMESFLRLVEALAEDGSEGPFLVSTVDTVGGRRTVADFFERASANRSDVALAVNEPAEDDNPLWVRCDKASGKVVALGAAAAGSVLATAGLYCVRSTILREAEAARRERISSLRAFLSRLLERGYTTTAVRIPNSIDVDRPADIIAAEKFVRELAT